MTFELIDEPSHEALGLWVIVQQAALSTLFAHTGVQSMWVWSQDGFAPANGIFRQDNLSFIQGDEYPITFWVRTPTAGLDDARLRVHLAWSDFSTTTLLDIHHLGHPKDVFVQYQVSFTANTSSADLVVNAIREGGFSLGRTDWYIDTWSLPQELLGIMKGKWLAITKLTDLLKQQIVGPPSYHLDVGGRVYNRDITPKEHEGIKLPYICVPLFLEGQTYPIFDRLTQTQWQQEILAYVTEAKAHDPLETTGARDIAHMHDDIIKAILSDLHLEGLLNAPIQATSTESISAVTDEEWAELSMKFQMAMNFGKDDLGPEGQ